jgi:glycosyltransferase involved in cell wall biosynthesis
MACDDHHKEAVTPLIKIEGGLRCRISSDDENGKRFSVSIITVVLNGIRSIEDTILSIKEQVFNDYEYFVIDGGSTHGTIETLRKYDDFITYWISEPDKGIYDAMNKGIDLACGEWIYFLGADDILIDSGALKRVFDRINQAIDRSKMIYGNVLWGKTGRVYDGIFSKDKIILDNICQQSIFYHNDIFREIGKFDLRYPLLADYVMNMKAFADVKVNPSYIDTVIARYSLSGLSSTKGDEIFLADRDFLIQKIFGFRYYRLFLNSDARVPDKESYGYLQALIHYFDYLNNRSEAPINHSVMVSCAKVWNAISSLHTKLDLFINNIKYKLYLFVNFTAPIGSPRRRLVRKVYKFICRQCRRSR